MAGESEYTVGVEEEFQIIDPDTRGLSPSGEALIERARRTLGEERVVPEMRAAQVEVLTPVCRTLSEVRAELARLRRGVIEAAAREGLLVAAASTHPFSHWQDQPITQGERYEKILRRERRMVEQQLVFGFHVHVGLGDRGTALRVMNRARLWLAPLLALSANSPFWLGEDTGYASYRSQLWGTLPTAGPPGHFASLAEHDELIEALVASRGAMEASQVYWDMRMPERLDTLEFRVADVCTALDASVMLTGLARALVRTCHESAERGEPYPRPRTEILRAAHWVASREGLEGRLVDVETARAVPAREVIRKMLALVRPALEEHGEWEEVSALVRETLQRGTGATRQRAVYERSGRLEEVVDSLVEETSRGTA